MHPHSLAWTRWTARVHTAAAVGRAARLAPALIVLAVAVHLLVSTGSATAQSVRCAGDCDGNGAVGIGELVLAVDIALANTGIELCPAADRMGDGAVDISDLIGAVDAALSGCPATPTPSDDASPSETPTATPTETPTVAVFAFNCVAASCFAVVNELDHNVSFVAMNGQGTSARNRAVGTDEAASGSTVPVGGIPRGIAVGADGRFAYVTTRSPDGLAVIDVGAQSVTHIDGVGALPEAVACTSDGSALMVTSFGDNNGFGNVSVVDLAGMANHLAARHGSSAALAGATLVADGTAQMIQVGRQPNALAVTGNLAYVTNFGSGSVSVIEIAQRRVRTTVQNLDLESPNSVAISPDGALAYVANFGNGMISVIRTDTDAVVKTFRLLSNFETHPTGLSFTPDGAGLYVTNFHLSGGELFGSVFVYGIDLVSGLPNSGPVQLYYTDLGMPDALPSSVRVSGGTAVVSNFLVAFEATGGGLRARATGGTLGMIDTAKNDTVESMPVGVFPVSLAEVPTAAVSPESTPTPVHTPPASATPTVGEQCGAVTCPAPNTCIRDLSCHKNGCPPHDRCCPPDNLSCMACVGGTNDGAACANASDCESGQCAAP